MKKITIQKKLLILSVLISGLPSLSQQFYNNGGLSTGTTTANGTSPSPAGYTWSELQSVAGVTNTSLGLAGYFLTAGTTNFRLADNFTVAAGEQLNLTSIDFYCYQTGYTGTTPPINQLRVQIWNGDPSLPSSTVLAGNLTTNVYSAAGSADALMYRIGNNVSGTTRKIWRVRATLAVNLPAGSYWVDYQMHPTNDAAMFMPTVTLPGVVNQPAWNAKQHNGTAWAPAVDGGSNLSVDMPFVINYDQFLGSESFATNNKMMLYPNPASEKVTIKMNFNALQEIPNSVEIYDLKGAMVLKQNLGVDDNDYSIDLATLPQGMYLVKIYDQNNAEIMKSKLIKQ